MRTNGHGIPIIALDVDGTIANYHQHFLWFAALWFGRAMPSSTQINPQKPLHKFMGVSLEDYRECKLAFRQGGLKRFMPCYEGASELTYRIQAEGAQVWICTTRPYLRLDNIDPDTRFWLHRNDIQYDAVLFGEDKYAELKRQAGDRVAAVFDDLPEQCDIAIKEGFPVFVRDQPYNITYEGVGLSGRVEDCDDMLNAALGSLAFWRGNNV